MNIFEQIEYEDFNCCKISIGVTAEGHLTYDRKKWKTVEAKLREAWSNANVFEISSQVSFNKDGLITAFTLASVKRGKIKPAVSEMKYYNKVVYCEIGNQVTSKFHEVLDDIKRGYLPKLLEDFENIETTSFNVDIAYKTMQVKAIEEQLRMAKYELKIAKQKLEEGVIK